jgi:putative tricarboxylic transport membrane protein
MFEQFLDAAVALFTLGNLLAMLVGTVAGIIIGALPGLTVTVGIAILIPLTFGIEPLIALGLIAGIFNGSSYGNAIPAILLNIPGTPAAIATTFDGYPMAQSGRTALALRVACYSSALGGAVSALCLMLLAPPLALITLAFGPAEYFWVAVLGLASIAILIGDDPLKGLISACLGLFISTIGMDRVTGQMRYTFGYWELVDGLSVVVVLTGLFAVSRVLLMAEEAKTTGIRASDLSVVGSRVDWPTFLSLLPTWLRSSIIGIVVGILPGVGGNVAALLSYNSAKQAAQDKETFGKGNPKGVAAAECGNSADNGSSLIPTLTLGVPGNAIAALILGALLVHGLQPGPALFRDNPDIVYGFMIQMFLTAIVLLALGGLVATRIFAQVLRLPGILLVPMIVGLTVIGIYTTTYKLFELYIALGFGLLGYFMASFRFPLAPLVLGLILGGMAEMNLRMALRISRGDWTFLFQNRISQILIVLIVITFAVPAIRNIRSHFARPRGSAAGQ